MAVAQVSLPLLPNQVHPVPKGTLDPKCFNPPVPAAFPPYLFFSQPTRKKGPRLSSGSLGASALGGAFWPRKVTLAARKLKGQLP